MFLQSAQRCFTTVVVYNGDGVTETLILMAKNSVDDVIIAGRVSSHPRAVIVLCKACNRIPIDLTFTAKQAKYMIKTRNIPYLSANQLVGSIFHT